MRNTKTWYRVETVSTKHPDMEAYVGRKYIICHKCHFKWTDNPKDDRLKRNLTAEKVTGMRKCPQCQHTGKWGLPKWASPGSFEVEE